MTYASDNTVGVGTWVLIAVGWCLVCAVLGAIVGRRAGNETLGAALGLLLGPFGVVAVAALSGCNCAVSEAPRRQAARRANAGSGGDTRDRRLERQALAAPESGPRDDGAIV